jgi:hypothetical protein
LGVFDQMTRHLTLLLLALLVNGCVLNPNWPERSALPLTVQAAPSGEMPSVYLPEPAPARARSYVTELSTK